MRPLCQHAVTPRISHELGAVAEYGISTRLTHNDALKRAIALVSDGSNDAAQLLNSIPMRDMSLLRFLDLKGLYGGRIVHLFRSVCHSDVQRFHYHASAELPCQQCGKLSLVADQYATPGHFAARQFGKPGSFWALLNPPPTVMMSEDRFGYAFPIRKAPMKTAVCQNIVAQDGAVQPFEIPDGENNGIFKLNRGVVANYLTGICVISGNFTRLGANWAKPHWKLAIALVQHEGYQLEHDCQNGNLRALWLRNHTIGDEITLPLSCYTGEIDAWMISSPFMHPVSWLTRYKLTGKLRP